MDSYYTFREAIIEALKKAYGIEDPRTSADGPDIEFDDMLIEALDDYVNSIIESNDFDMSQVCTIVGNNPTIRPNNE